MARPAPSVQSLFQGLASLKLLAYDLVLVWVGAYLVSLRCIGPRFQVSSNTSRCHTLDGRTTVRTTLCGSFSGSRWASPWSRGLPNCLFVNAAECELMSKVTIRFEVHSNQTNSLYRPAGFKSAWKHGSARQHQRYALEPKYILSQLSTQNAQKKEKEKV
ncbi:hypothetical protein K438DRAFT_408607 [Mycena galopus ATCC 62051]|nr:hypothetical protein K438DRAFT_408607 [Mycena galopus ATCC 62051]